MDRDLIIQEYVKYGGVPGELTFQDDSDLPFLLEIQKSIYLLESGDTQRDTPRDTPSLGEQLFELQNTQIVAQYGTDEHREELNKRTILENRLREELALPPKPLEVLDSELLKLLILDQMKVGPACKEYLSAIEEQRGRGSVNDLTLRLKELSATIQREADRDKDYLTFLSYASTTLARLSKKIPQSYILSLSGVLANPERQLWEQDLRSLKVNLEKKFKIAESLESNLDIKPDKRSSIYRLYDRLLKLEGESNGQREVS
jgi:hypothetical protein